jgi:hypothetical protein
VRVRDLRVLPVLPLRVGDVVGRRDGLVDRLLVRVLEREVGEEQPVAALGRPDRRGARAAADELTVDERAREVHQVVGSDDVDLDAVYVGAGTAPPPRGVVERREMDQLQPGQEPGRTEFTQNPAAWTRGHRSSQADVPRISQTLGQNLVPSWPRKV